MSSSILIGIDGSERSEDAIAFGRRLASASSAPVVIGGVFHLPITAGRYAAAQLPELRAAAEQTVREKADQLTGISRERVRVRIIGDSSTAAGLHHLAEAEDAALVVVGSTHTGALGRVAPGSTGERLLHGAPCAVAVVPNGYRTTSDAPLGRIGVAYNTSEESTAAVAAAVEFARAFGATLEIISVVSTTDYSAPAIMGGPSLILIREDTEKIVQDGLDVLAAGLPDDIRAETVRPSGDVADELAERSAGLDLLVTGSRGYGPLRAVVMGGVSGRLVREAQCPVIVVPRGVEAPLDELFSPTTATVA